MVVTVRFGPWVARHVPLPGFLVTLGQASLPVFVTHLILVLLVLGTLGGDQYARSWPADGLLLAGVFGTLYLVARLVLWRDRRRAAKGLPVRAKPGVALASAKPLSAADGALPTVAAGAPSAPAPVGPVAPLAGTVPGGPPGA
ncbi:MAG: hypothetical protein GAK30_03175 [Paracidovorax wautersii]|uniref:Uncharacterized protein n=1 Tax=Paracidovorax wautersii TaxID=1177982 RepID=A0A7V8FLN6_9BURK|nr:MAG: hypothetical protein GAK30_03175 [Paracidovorax wautersii]